MRILKSALLAISLCLATLSAHAVPLLTNGGFETGDFTGWTASTNGSTTCDNDWNVSSSNVSGSATLCGGGGGFGLTNPGAPIEGSFAAYNSFDGNGPQTFSLSQSILVPTSVGSATLSWFESGGFVFIDPAALARVWDVFLGGVSVFSSSFTTNQDINWTAMSFDVTSILAANAGSSIDLLFSNFIPEGFTGPAGWGLDGVVLDSRVAVPEPGTLGLLGFGLAGIAWVRRRKLA